MDKDFSHVYTDERQHGADGSASEEATHDAPARNEKPDERDRQNGDLPVEVQ